MPTLRRSTVQTIAMVAMAIGLCQIVDAHHAVLRFNLEEMVVTADRVFVGRCVAVDTGREAIAQGQLPVTYYTFDVEQVLKGELPARFTFTQMGTPPRPAFKGGPTVHGQAAQTGLELHGAADYGVGDRLLVFLIPNYQNGRLTYPVGLDQGVFRIDSDGAGQQFARNNLNNLGLFTAPFNGTAMKADAARVITPDAAKSIAPAAAVSDAARALPDARGALPLAPLMELIQQIHHAHGGAAGRLVAAQPGGRR
jgi:hypothetical protein